MSMMKPGFKTFGLGLIGVAILSAASFWETKDYTEWRREGSPQNPQ